jgi:hypothetical protein
MVFWEEARKSEDASGWNAIVSTALPPLGSETLRIEEGVCALGAVVPKSSESAPGSVKTLTWPFSPPIAIRSSNPSVSKLVMVRIPVCKVGALDPCLP